MTHRQEKIIAVSKWRYPDDGDLDKQTAFIEGYKFAKNDNLGFGFFLGMFFFTVLAVVMLTAYAFKEPTTYPQANALLNSPEWRIDTVDTWIHGQDTTRTYRFVRNN